MGERHQRGEKHDAGKPRVGLMFSAFPRALLEVARAHTHGAVKYSPCGWLLTPDGVARYDDAKGRHLLTGHIHPLDTDSELLHATHEAWNALAKLELMLREQGDHHDEDDTESPIE